MNDRYHPTWSEVKPAFMATTVPINATCGTCRWWHPLGSESGYPRGHCHYNPPVLGGWPETLATTDVCSAWTTDYFPEERTGRLVPRQDSKSAQGVDAE